MARGKDLRHKDKDLRSKDKDLQIGPQGQQHWVTVKNGLLTDILLIYK